MRKKMAVTVALTAGLLCGGRVKPAFAEWVEVPNPYEDQWPHPPEYETEQALRLDGTVDWGFDSYYSGTLQHDEGTDAWEDVGNGAAGFLPFMVLTKFMVATFTFTTLVSGAPSSTGNAPLTR